MPGVVPKQLLPAEKPDVRANTVRREVLNRSRHNRAGVRVCVPIDQALLKRIIAGMRYQLPVL